MLPAPLAALGAYRQFIACKLVPLPNGKTDKIPVSAITGEVGIDAHDSKHWVGYNTASAHCAASGHHPAFVLTKNDPLFCLDLDGVNVGGGWSPLVDAAMRMLPGAACELSQSGKGLHLWGSYQHIDEHRCKPSRAVRAKLAEIGVGGIELYHWGRFICLGSNAVGDSRIDQTAALGALIAQWLPAGTQDGDAPELDWGDAPVAEWRGPTDDDELIRRMLASKPSMAAAFGTTASVKDLWEANEAVLAKSFPSGTGDVYDRSGADAALASHLSFWTGKNQVRIERLMLRSGLLREKYYRDDYLRQRTIPFAVSGTGNVYQERQVDLPAEAPAAPTVASSRLVTGDSFCWPEKQQEMWKGYAYVTEDNKVLTANGEMLNESRFNAKYGGLSYVMDAGNEKRTDKAFEAFVYSKAVRHTKVDRATFRPDLPERTVFTQDGLTLINTFRRVDVPRKKGDATPFLEHLKRIVPNPRDRDIVLYYMAALVQFQGHKFGWALFIQGTFGNGKSLLSLCVKAAIGDVYCHMPRALGLIEDKNDWMARTTFCGVEDLHLPRTAGDISEILKPMITLDIQPIRAMGIAQVMKRVCVNFLINANDKNEWMADDRRYAQIFCPQQRPEHRQRDGLTPLYFTKLFHWLEQEGGYAIVSDLLHTIEIPAEFGLPYLKGVAPATSSTEEAVSLAVGPVEAEVLEAVAQCRVGFCGGWVSSIALDELLKEKRMEKDVNRSKRQALMERLGYEHHPSLYGGRASTPLITGQRPVLYVKLGHVSCNIKSAAEVTRAFEKAQNEQITVAAFGKAVA